MPLHRLIAFFCALFASFALDILAVPTTNTKRSHHENNFLVDHNNTNTLADSALTEPTQVQDRPFNSLPRELLNEIVDRINHIVDRARLKSVNKEFNGLVPRVPGATKCKNLNSEFTINATAQTATFPKHFLVNYLSKLLPYPMTIIAPLSLDYNRVRIGFQEFWECVNALSLDNYTIQGIDEDDIRAFESISLARSVPFRMDTNPLRILISEMVNDPELHDTSFGLTIMRSGVDVYPLLQLVWTLMPTYKSFQDGEVPYYDALFPNVFERVVGKNADGYEYKFQGRSYYFISDDNADDNSYRLMENKTLELLDAFAIGLVNVHLKMPPAHNPSLRLIRLLEDLSFALHTSFSADNVLFFRSMIQPSFLQGIARQVGVLEYAQGNVNEAIGELVEDEFGSSDLVSKVHLLLRIQGRASDAWSLIRGVSRERALLPNRPAFLWPEKFPRIHAWYLEMLNQI